MADSNHTGATELRRSIFDEINAERARQDEQWGGPGHDDEHEQGDWLEFIGKQLDAARKLYWGGGKDGPEADKELRERLVKIAALAVAALEAEHRFEHGAERKD